MSEIGLGTRIGAYRVLALIGQGGMGTVYRAEHVQSGAPVALKLLSDSLAASEPFRRRFEREARYARELDHPNVIPVEEVGDDGGRMYMVMPEVRGADLKMLLTLDGPLEAARAIAVLAPIADALDALHERGILHRDIKPGNVIVASGEGPEPAGTAYLTDFGLGKDQTRDSGPLTAVGEFVGTFQYASPEQVLGQELDHRVDIYALGCLLYECLTGRPPFARPNAVDVLDAHLEDPPPAVTAARPELPAAIDAVVARAMAKDRADRFETASETIEAGRTALGVADAVVQTGAQAAAPAPERPGEAARSGEPDPAAPGAPGALRLRAVTGNAAGAEILVTDELVIGRESEGAGRLAGDAEISRRHARVWRSNVGFMVVDLGSTNGTLVGGRAIVEPRLLVAGDELELGGTKLVVEAAAPSTGGSPAETIAAVAGEAADAPVPRLVLRLEVDFGARRGLVRVGEGGAPLEIAKRADRWVVEPSDT